MSSPRRSNGARTLAAATLLVLLAGCGGGGGGSGSTGGTGGGSGTAACAETVRKQFVLDASREWYLFDTLLPATRRPRQLRHRRGTARSPDGHRPRPGQGPVLQLPDDEERRELAARRRPVRRLRLPHARRSREPADDPRRLRVEPGRPKWPCSAVTRSSPSTPAAVTSPCRSCWRAAAPSPTHSAPRRKACGVACACCATA